MAALMSKTELEEAPMTIVVGLDVHGEQITFDALDTKTGEVRRGRIRPADRESCRRLLPGSTAGRSRRRSRPRPAGLHRRGALGGRRGGALAEPAETRSLRGRKRRAKTDRLLRNLLLEGRLPES
jgi:transposase